MASDAFIQCRVSSATKLALRAAAQRQQVSESALLKRMLLVVLAGTGSVGEPATAPDTPGPIERRARLCIRLTGEDQRLLRERAAARAVAPALYVSMLIPAHLRAVTPIPAEELGALRTASAELAAIGRNINQIARELQSGRAPAGIPLPHLGTFLELCKALHANFQSYIRRNAESWTRGHAAPSAQP